MFAPSPAPRRSQTPTRVVRLCVILYWAIGLAFGSLRLSRAGWQGPDVAFVFTAWYVMALLFLGCWGGAALILGLLSSRERRPRKRSREAYDPLRTRTLAAIERQRGR